MIALFYTSIYKSINKMLQELIYNINKSDAINKSDRIIIKYKSTYHKIDDFIHIVNNTNNIKITIKLQYFIQSQNTNICKNLLLLSEKFHRRKIICNLHDRHLWFISDHKYLMYDFKSKVLSSYKYN